jgi:hypothetical protein
MNAILEHESNPKIKFTPAKSRRQRFSSPLGSSVVSTGNRWKRWVFRGKCANAMPKRQSHLGNTG